MSVYEYNSISKIRGLDFLSTPRIDKPKPTNVDRNTGRFYRYFMSKVNDPYMVREVNKRTYDDFDKNTFWTKVRLNWVITGTEDEVSRLNKIQIMMGDEKIAGLSSIITNLLEYRVGGGFRHVDSVIASYEYVPNINDASF